jgi:hypothetical protein
MYNLLDDKFIVQIVDKLRATTFDTDVDVVIERMIGSLHKTHGITLEACWRRFPVDIVTIGGIYEYFLDIIRADLGTIKKYPTCKEYIFAPYQLWAVDSTYNDVKYKQLCYRVSKGIDGSHVKVSHERL